MVYVSGKGSPEEVNDPCIKEWLDSGKADQRTRTQESFNTSGLTLRTDDLHRLRRIPQDQQWCGLLLLCEQGELID